MLPYLATGVSAAMETKWELVSMAAETTLVMNKLVVQTTLQLFIIKFLKPNEHYLHSLQD